MTVSGKLAWHGLAMLLLAMAQALIYYFLSINDRAFVPVLPLCCAVLVGLVDTHHGSVAAIVQTVVAANGLLLVGLLALFVPRARREGAGIT